MELLPPPIRLGDHLALDFVNTVASPKGFPVDWIPDGKAFVAWLRAVEVLDSQVAERILTWRAESEIDRAAKDARELREWFRGLLERLKVSGRQGLLPEDIARLNEVLARDSMFLRLEGGGEEKALHLAAARRWRDAGEMLAPVAASIAELICDADLDLVRRCENPACTIWFYDRTKGHRRRWCSQAFCGNRAKVAAFRERQRASSL